MCNCQHTGNWCSTIKAVGNTDHTRQTWIHMQSLLSPLPRCGPVVEGVSGKVHNWTVPLLNHLHQHHDEESFIWFKDSDFLNSLMCYFLHFFCLQVIFSSPEPKTQVSYCHSTLSVVWPSTNFCIFNFFSRTAWWILMKLGRDKVLMVPYKCCCFSARSAQGWIQGGEKIVHGSPLLQEISVTNLQWQTECIAII